MSKIVKVYKGNDYAIISRYNAYFRFYDGETELFFSEYSNALKHALNKGYFVGFPY